MAKAVMSKDNPRYRMIHIGSEWQLQYRTDAQGTREIDPWSNVGKRGPRAAVEARMNAIASPTKK